MDLLYSGGASGFEAENRDNGHMITSSITAPCICRGIMKYIPKLADAKIVRTWAGYEDLCADGVPVLGPVKEVPGLLLACAFTRTRIWNFTDCRKTVYLNWHGKKKPHWICMNCGMTGFRQ